MFYILFNTQRQQTATSSETRGAASLHNLSVHTSNRLAHTGHRTLQSGFISVQPSSFVTV